MIKSFLLSLFKPIMPLMGTISFWQKNVLISFFLLFPFGIVFTYTYMNIDDELQKLHNNISHLENNHVLYQVLLFTQDYELKVKQYYKDTQNLNLKKEFELSQSRLIQVAQDGTGFLEDEYTCESFIKQINLALLNNNFNKLKEYTQGYKSFIYTGFVPVHLISGNQNEENLAVLADLISEEIPYSNYVLSNVINGDNRNDFLLALGKFMGLSEKNNILMKQLSLYPDQLQSLHLRYEESIKEYEEYSLSGETEDSNKALDEVLSLQLSLFNLMQDFLLEALEETSNDLQNKKIFYVLFLTWCAFISLYLFLAGYLSLTLSLRQFFMTTAKISNGEFDSRVERGNNVELDKLALEFNKMIESLDYHYSLLSEYKKAMDSSAIVVKTDKQGLITYVNREYEKISGYTKSELIGSTHRLIKSKHTSTEQISELWKYLQDKKIYKTVFENIAKNGKSFFVESTIVPILNRSSEISEFIAVMFDITPLHKQKERLQAQLYKDELTSLPNRLKLLEDIKHSKDAKLVVINIDRFKEINTIYGEHLGDLTLQKMAQEIKGSLKTRHLQLYKLSADEFAILAGNNISIEHFKEDVAMLAHYLSDIKLRCEGHEISVRLSLGAAISELHHLTRPLISMADMALKEAKHKMKPYVFYNDIDNIDEDLEKNYKMIQIIENAIKEDKVGCSYQGLINSKTGRIEKYETLMRLEDSQGKKISPQDFVSIAKKARLYPMLTQKLVYKALSTFIKRTESVSINLSIDDLMDDNTYSFILDALRHCPCAKRVIFELLETEEIEFNERVIEFTSSVKKLGAKIAIDDFGSGYSNYAYLIKLGVDILKIDASLIKEVHTNENSRLIVRSIIDIAQALGMQTVAEHVHIKEVHDIMVEMGVDFLQGYYLHKPISNLP
ncbi:EAL domain-containing protein [Sulfurimonas sp. MAG313]|nr:EAL domain-containing protein [Sulfurimonas sp. MAG313]MDF1880148.1 EAL domain-containing protein [Sulfurimonas sp. MAG313]